MQGGGQGRGGGRGRMGGKGAGPAAAAFAPHVELESLTKEVFPAIRELARNAGVK